MPYDPTMTDEQVVAAFLHRVKARQAAEQREKRVAASRAAKASVSLEGFKVSAEYEAAERLYDEGKITFDDLLAIAKKPASGNQSAA